MNRKMTREERINKLYRIDKIELATGKLVWNIIAGIIGAGIVLGIFWLIGIFTSWIEASTFRFIIFSIFGIIFTIRWVLAEASLQEETKAKAKRYR